MRRRLALVIALALLGACGSTVPKEQRAARLQPRSGDLGTPLPGDTDTTLLPGGDGGAAVGGTRTGANPTTRSNTRTTAGGAAVTFGPGVTADTIFVGLSYATGNDANAAIGAAGITQGDPKAQDEALIDDINKHGGIAGRKVQGVFHPFNPNSPTPWDVLDQQACDDWTHDHKIFVALAEPIGDSDTLASCLDSRGASFVNSGLSTSDAARFRRFTGYVDLISMNLDRAVTAEVDALKAQGWFGGWDFDAGTPAKTKAKVGIVTYEGAAWAHAVDQTLVPALRAAGYAPAARDIVRIPHEQATSDTGSTAAATSSAVLKLRGDNVSHVIVLDRKALLTLFFARAADSQGYRPRYGLNTQNGVQALMSGNSAPAAQFIGSKGIGWFPTLDLPPAVSASSAYTNDTKKKCLALYKSHNISFSDANAESVGMNTCSLWWFFRDAVNAAGGELTRPAFVRGIDRLGTSYLSAANFVNRFSSTQHDGVGAYRYYAHDEGCGCMKYTSGNVAAP